jgi:hypothetical protein
MATASEVGLSVADANRAQAALSRLAAVGRVFGRFEPVQRSTAPEGAFDQRVVVHDGPAGHGRTIYVEVQRANLLLRRTAGDGPHGVTSDGWKAIDLSKAV